MKNKMVAILLFWFIGLGRWYIGDEKWVVRLLLRFVVIGGILDIIDIINILTGKLEPLDGSGWAE